jgi:hypothetical protein
MLEDQRPLGLQILIGQHASWRLSSRASAALRPSSGSCLRSSPSSSIKSKSYNEHAAIVASVSDPLEQRDAVVPARDCLAIEDAGTREQTGQGLNDEREASCKVVARDDPDPRGTTGRLRGRLGLLWGGRAG